MMEKIQPETLQLLLLEVLSHAPQFKYISGTQPFLMSFAEQEYYVYVKNLSSAYFKERIDTTRAQLPIKDEFEEIKQSPVPFVFLGYDQINDVLVCWNYHIAKSRLNEKKSVSFYSRIFFQEEVVEGEFLRKRLKNDDVPVLFKRKDLVSFFEQIDSFFPSVESSDGNNTETDVVQPILPLTNKKITEIIDRELLQQLKPLLAINSPHTLEAIKLVQSHYGNMPAMKFRDWAKLIKSVKFDDPNHAEYSLAKEQKPCAAEPEFEFCTCSNEKEFIRYMRTHLSEKSITHYVTALSGRISEGIRQYLDPTLTNIFMVSDTAIISDWLTRLFLKMEFKELDCVGKKMYSCAIKKYLQFLQQRNEKIESYNTKEDTNGKKKTHILRVTFPDGTVVEEKRVSETLVKVVEYAGIENVKSLNINTCGENIIVSETEINPRYEKATKYIDGLYVNTCCDTQTKYNIINKISQMLDLGLLVDFVSVNDHTIVEVNPPTSIRAKIKVTFPNGKTIQYAKVLETLIEVILYAGVENVRNLNIRINNDNLVTNNVTPTYEVSLKPLGNGFFVHTNSRTDIKLDQISQISKELKLGLTIELV